MIEVVYEKGKQKPEGNEEFFRIPNNIRQIGEVSETQKIYIEDYAYTYLCRISSENSQKGKAAILLGQSNFKNGSSYLFVKSAVVLPDMEITEDHLAFTKEIWNHVYEKNKEFFSSQEIVGWYLSVPGCSMELHEVICKTHLDHFGGNDKVLMVMEPLEKEEAFYRFESGKLCRQTGFYIYYEKNESMQSFLISQNEKAEQKSEKVDDKAVRNFRKKIENKGEKTQEPKVKSGRSIYRLAGACAMVVVIAMGVLYLNDYQKLEKTEPVIAGLDNEKNQEEPEKTTPVNGLVSENQQKDPAAQQEDAAAQENQGAGDESNAQPGSETANNNAAAGETAQSVPNTPDSTTAPVGNTGIVMSGSHTSYTIQDGDTITSISNQHYGSSEKIKEICALNGLTTDDLIFPGQKILLP